MSKTLLLNRSPATGFRSPAEDVEEQDLNLHSELIKNRASTFIFRVAGDLTTDSGISSGDLLIIDQSLNPVNQDLVLSVINGTLKIMCLTQIGNQYFLADKTRSSPTALIPAADVEIRGVVTTAIKRFRIL